MEGGKPMSQNNLDNLLLFSLFIVVIGDLLAFLIELQSQRQQSETEKAEQEMKQEIRDLHNEVNLLKMEIAKKWSSL